MRREWRRRHRVGGCRGRRCRCCCRREVEAVMRRRWRCQIGRRWRWCSRADGVHAAAGNGYRSGSGHWFAYNKWCNMLFGLEPNLITKNDRINVSKKYLQGKICDVIYEIIIFRYLMLRQLQQLHAGLRYFEEKVESQRRIVGSRPRCPPRFASSTCFCDFETKSWPEKNWDSCCRLLNKKA